MSILRVLLMAVAFAACTYFFGWVSVPLIGAIYAIIRRDFGAPSEAALAALLGWGGLLARVAMVPAFSVLLDRLGKILPIPGAVTGLVTLVFAAALAWAGARVITMVVGRERVAV
ncbi:MAG: hypothetical protein ABJC26_10160 [Gemmatimonadaceae bacterium]